jgi:hypothetical protein
MPFESRVVFHDLAGLPLPDLQARVRQLPPDSIVFYLSVSDDGAGHTVMPLDALDPIAAVANAPVYSWHEDQMQLHISDSGVGFDPFAADQSGLGLASMRERVSVLKGHLVIHASPGQGTRIGVSVPLTPPRDGHFE